MRRANGKWIVREQRERSWIVVQKFPDEMQRPRIFRWRSHGSEPNLPVDPRLIRGDERRAPIGITWLGFELVFLPFCIGGHDGVIRSFKNNLVAFFSHCTEGAVGIHQAESIK